MSLLEKRIIEVAHSEAEEVLDNHIYRLRNYLGGALNNSDVYDAVDELLAKIKKVSLPILQDRAEKRAIENFFQKVQNLGY